MYVKIFCLRNIPQLETENSAYAGTGSKMFVQKLLQIQFITKKILKNKIKYHIIKLYRSKRNDAAVSAAQAFRY